MPRRLVVCCDGTWNRPDQLHGGMPAPTNVTKVAAGVAREDGEGSRQLLHYHPGVGTRRFERVRGGAFGRGLSRNVRDCYRFLAESYEPGDELFFFGFSRGAFTARSTVGLVRNAGILRPEHVGRIDEAYRLYRARADRTRPNGIEARIFRRMYSHEEIEIRFVGVWDTVGALGIPIDGVRLPFADRLWGFHDTELSSRVRFAYQALAIDEQRGPFRPTLWRQQEHATEQTLEQVWFAGVHSDVGGGYPEPELAEIPLLWMVERARDCGLAFEPDHFRSATQGVDEDRRRVGADIAPDALGTMHESRKGFYLLLPRHRRSLTDPAGSALSLASSAARRRREMPDYDPPGLDDYVAGGGPVTTVQDGA
ncbi:MAG: DUF2235 domain-containing protein [Actinomycetota bacterium]|nr:DUF2235 domain-containing protein [Actinomycetota bacterium]